MKNYRSPLAFLFCAALLSGGCTKRISQYSLNLAPSQICSASMAGQPTTCLPVDNQHLVTLSLQDDAPFLQALSLAQLPGAPGSLPQLAHELKRLGLAHAFDPRDTEIHVVDGDWIFASKHADAAPRVTLSKERMHHGKSLLLNDGDEWLLTTLTTSDRPAPPTPPTAEGDIIRDLTDSIKIATGRICPLRLVVEGTKVTAHYGIGVAEVLDDAGLGSNQRRGDAGSDLQRWLKALQPDALGDLTFASPDGQIPSPFSLAAHKGSVSDAPGFVPEGASPGCLCETLGRRVIYKDHALYFDNGTRTDLWVDLKDMDCEFCIDRYKHKFRIVALKDGCGKAFNCTAVDGCESFDF